MGVFASIGKGFKLANQNWKMISMIFGFYLAMGLINLPIQNNLPRAGGNLQDVSVFWGAMAILMLVVNFLAGVFLQGGLLSFVKEIIKTGQSSFANFWQSGKKFYLKLFLFSLLVVAAIIVLMVVMLMCGLLFSALAKGDQAVIQIIILVFIILGGISGFIGSIFVVFSPFIIVDKEEKLFTAISSSFKLAAKSFWPMLGLLIVMGLGVVGISVLLVMLVNLPFGGNVTAGVQVLNVVLNSLLAGYFSLVIISAMMNYYLGVSKPKEEPVF